MKKFFLAKKAIIFWLILFFSGIFIFPEFSFGKMIKAPTFPNTTPKPIADSFLVEFVSDPEISEVTPSPVMGVNSSQTLNSADKIRKFRSQKFPELNKKLETLKVKRIKGLSEKKKNIYKMSLEKGATAQKVINELKASPSVVKIEQNLAIPLAYNPNDPYFRLGSGDPKNYYQWNLAAINAPLAWNITKGVTSVRVAVIDSGLAFEDYQGFRKAPELAGINVLPGKRYSSIKNCSEDCSGCLDLEPPVEDNHPNDEFGHGTHVTMTIVQAMNNANHATGIAPNVSLIPIRASGQGNTGCLSEDAIIVGLDYAKNQGANVVNMSFGGSSLSTAVKNKIDELYNAGVSLVAATGNSADRDYSPRIIFPAAFPNVIAVGASRWDNMRAVYSQYGAPYNGQNVTLLAPGGQIINDEWTDFEDKNNDGLPDGIVQQTIISGQPAAFTQIDETLSDADCYSKKCIAEEGENCLIKASCGLYMGTSMATPHVSAVVALMKSVNFSLTPSQIKNILVQTANKNIPNYNSNEHGAGLLDAQAAVIAAAGNPTSTPPTCPFWELGNVNCDTTGLRNNEDVEVVKDKWRPAGPPLPTPNPGQRSADVTQDSKIDEADLTKLFSNWKTQP